MIHVHVGRDLIQQQQEADADKESHRGRNERQLPHPFAALQRRLQKAPEGGCHHDACSKPGKDLLNLFRKLSPQEKDHRRAEAGAEKGDQDTLDYFNIHAGSFH